MLYCTSPPHALHPHTHNNTALLVGRGGAGQQVRGGLSRHRRSSPRRPAGATLLLLLNINNTGLQRNSNGTRLLLYTIILKSFSFTLANHKKPYFSDWHQVCQSVRTLPPNHNLMSAYQI